MKRTLIRATLLFAVAGALSATSIISCGGTSALGASTVCSNSQTYGTVLQTFALNLQWNNSANQTSGTLAATDINAPASANGMAYNTTWNSVGLPIMLAMSGTAMELADNYVNVQRSSKWVLPTGSYPQPFEGTFDAQPNAGAGTPGDYLLGSANQTPIAIKTTPSSVFLSGFGFRIASQDLTAFDVAIQLLDFSGNVIETMNVGNYPVLGNLSGGGNGCTTLAAQFPNAPVPCNTAPFIAVLPGNGVAGFSVMTTSTSGGADLGGFYIDTFYFNGYSTDPVPEPASVLLTGIGFASLVAFARRRNRRQA